MRLNKRRQTMPAKCLSALAGLAALMSAFPLAASDWPQFLGPTRDGHYAGPPLNLEWPSAGPERLWTVAAGSGYSGPVVVGNRVVLYDRGEDQARVRCLSIENGGVLWSANHPTDYRDDFGFDNGPRATPAAQAGRVYTYGAEGVCLCLHLEQGRELWRVDTRQRFGSRKGFFGRAPSPLIVGDVVILVVGGTGGAGVVALDAATGELRWQAVDDEAGYAAPVAVSSASGTLVLALTRSYLVGLDPAAGQVRFQASFRPPVQASVTAASPVVLGGEALVSTAYGTGGRWMDLRTGRPGRERQWTDTMLAHYATPVLHGGKLYGFSGRVDVSPGASLRCVDWTTGQVRWSEDDFGAGTVLLAGDQLLVLREEGELVVAPANPERFELQARAQLMDFVRPYPALADGLLLVRGEASLACFDLRKHPPENAATTTTDRP